MVLGSPSGHLPQHLHSSPESLAMKYVVVLLCYQLCWAAEDDENEWVHSLPWQDFLLYGGIAVGLILLGGTMSGLTVGMLSLDELELEMKLAIGSAEEREWAEQVLPLINRHHLLLVSLLVANTAAAETLPIMLHMLFNDVISVIMSVSFILLFGEVLPQALCTGPNQLEIASRCAPLVRLVICITLPVSYPISLLLDRFFKEEDEDDGEERLIDPGMEQQAVSSSNEDSLSEKQVRMIHAAIQSGKETVAGHMIPVDRVFSISSKTVLNNNTLLEIRRKGFSRVPVYKDTDTDCFIGVMLVKRLLAINANESLILENSSLELRQPVVTTPSESLLNLLDIFEHGRSHMAIVVEHVRATQPEEFKGLPESTEPRPQRVLGIITLENVLEQLLKISIFDEEDFDHQHQKGEQRRQLSSMSRKRVFGHMPLFSTGSLFKNQPSLRSPAVGPQRGLGGRLS